MTLKRQVLRPNGARSSHLQHLPLDAYGTSLSSDSFADDLTPTSQQLLKSLPIAPTVLSRDCIKQVRQRLKTHSGRKIVAGELRKIDWWKN
jgi:hypothetical protein